MAKGDTKTEQYLDVAAHGSRANLPTDTCCETRTQTLVREVAERIINLEEEVHEWEDDPDVVDIVNTYADLQEYDTSDLTDKDIIRVLNDETHGGQSTYYRLSKTPVITWTYIGSTGPKAEQSDWDEENTTDMAYILNKPFYSETVSSEFEQGTTTTSGTTPDTDYVWFIEQFQDYALHTVLADFEDGDTVYATITYSVDGTSKSDTGKFTLTFEDGKANLDYDAPAGTRWTGAYISEVNLGDTTVRWPVLATDSSATVYITDIEYEKVKQIDPKYIPDDGGGGSSINVVQTTGTSTTDVMSQNAATNMLYLGGDKQKIYAGRDDGATISAGRNIVMNTSGYGSTTVAGNYNVLLLDNKSSASLSSSESVIIGGGSALSGTMSGHVGIGQAIKLPKSAMYAVALGYGANPTMRGQVDISTTAAGNTYGYNNSAYRLLTGLYNGQSAHDAATVGQAVGATETYTIATSDWSALSASSPYDYQATVTATYTIGANTIAELLNDSPVDFATYGFAIGSISSQSVTIYSIGVPSASVSLKVNYKG